MFVQKRCKLSWDKKIEESHLQQIRCPFLPLLYSMSCCIIAICFMSSALCYVLINSFMFFNLSVFMFVVCFTMFCCLFCVLCFCIFCVLFLHIYIVVYFLFVYSFTDHCHRLETQLNFIYIYIYIYIISHQCFLVNSFISLLVAYPYDRVLTTTEEVNVGI